MSRADQRRALLIFLGVAAVAVAIVGFLVLDVVRFPDRPQGKPGAPMKVDVPRGSSLRDVTAILAQKGLVERPTLFRLYANQRGVAAKIKAGRYTLEPGKTPRELLDTLLAGAPDEEVTITIPEGKNLHEVADLFAASGLSTREQLLAAAFSPALRRELGVPGESLEGYLFPDTYKVPVKASLERILGIMVQRHRKVYGELAQAHKSGVAELERTLGWGAHEIVIMASIVEKETGQAHERPRIANVFLNRLRLKSFVPHRLETDPTIIYGCTIPQRKSAACQKFEGRIRTIHLRDPDNPYNTYTHEGLPPGPITNPGRMALRAVMAPERGEYLFFVSKNDGTHVFSRTKEEHERWVDRYQRGL